jgi:hypothetical protein
MAISHPALPIPEPVPVPAPEPWRLSAIALLIANSVPLVGVLAFQWTVFPILLLYWCENVVVGIYNVLRMIFAEPEQPVMWVVKAFLIPFFTVHYGGFTMIHGMFVMMMFSGAPGAARMTPASILPAVRAADVGFGIAALVLSHGISFVHNYLMGGEYRRTNPVALMMRPYGRVMVMHITIIAGGALVMALHSAVPALVVLIALKTGIDLAAHHAERRKLAPETPLGETVPLFVG